MTDAKIAGPISTSKLNIGTSVGSVAAGDHIHQVVETDVSLVAANKYDPVLIYGDRNAGTYQIPDDAPQNTLFLNSENAGIFLFPGAGAFDGRMVFIMDSDNTPTTVMYPQGNQETFPLNIAHVRKFVYNQWTNTWLKMF